MGWREFTVGKLNLCSVSPLGDTDKGWQTDVTIDEIEAFGIEMAIDRAWAKLREPFIDIVKKEMESREGERHGQHRD